MVSGVRAPLTKIGFRRDVKLFLSSLVGFLIVLIFVLVLVLRTNLAHMEEAIDRSETVIADVAADTLNRSTPAQLDAQLTFIRQRFRVDAIDLALRDGGHLSSGSQFGDFDELTRLTTPGKLTLRFDASQRRAIRRRFLLTSAICVAAASFGILLLLLYVPRILQPIEEMLDHAKELGDRGDQEESAYLIETFRNSIATLRTQEEELKRLHDLEKTRADGLETRVEEMQTLAQLGEISAGIAHEFRNSISTILGYMKLVRKSAIDDAAEGRLQNAEKEASLLLQAIERLLAFARPVQLNAERVDLRELMDDQVRQLGDVSSDVAIDVAGPSIEIAADRVLLNRAVENLLRNAVDAVRQKGGGSVQVTLNREPSPTVTIADDGIGFDPAETPRLFLPFQSNKPNGFGMGLPLARKIMLLHGGTLRLQGEPGRGAVATMEFPAE